MKNSVYYDLPNGMRIHVNRFEPANSTPSGLTVLMLHGFLDCGATWDLVAEPLAQAGHDVFVPDLRGYGDSAHVGVGGYYHFPDYVGDVASLVDQIKAPRLALIGHSMGGTIASLYAGTMPSRIEKLALIEGLGIPDPGPGAALFRMRAWLDDLNKLEKWRRPLASFEEAVERLARMHSSIPRENIERITRKLVRTDASGVLRWAHDPLHRTTAPTPFSLEAFKIFLRNITVPTLFVSGGKQGWRLPDENERLACIANVRHVDIEDAGHMLHWKVPGALAECLLEFLAS